MLGCFYGRLAQLGEHLLDVQGVKSSSLLVTTIFGMNTQLYVGCFCLMLCGRLLVDKRE